MGDRPTAVLICDMEGASGVYRRRQVHTGKIEWRRARGHYTRDVAAVARGLRAGGVGRVIVRDIHDTGFNLFPDRLGPGVVWRPGAEARRGRFPYGDFGGVALAGFVGAHVGAGQEGFFPHTVWGTYEAVRVDGVDVDEIDLIGAILGLDGVPVAFVSGEHRLASSVRARYPWVEAVAIDKDEAANTGPDREALWAEQRRRLHAAAARAAAATGRMRPIERTGPCRFEVVFRREGDAARRAAVWRMERSGASVAWRADDFRSAFDTFLRLTFFGPRSWALRRWLVPLLAAANRLRLATT